MTNLVAIQFASSVVLLICGYNKLTLRGGPGRGVLLRHAPSFGIVPGVALGLHAVQTMTNHLFEADTREADPATSSLSRLRTRHIRFRRTTDKVAVIAQIKALRPIGPDEVAVLEDGLRAPTGTIPELIVQTILTCRATGEGYLPDESRSDVGAPTGRGR